ncbi:methyl-accepting chemotaxis protein [Thalassotalea insulae]|uniref:Methyl-accepting chemotaxis protein n=1 Tax=Thalassotalea insulae TaxID=2056778 RepID=A0ABQ6GYD2_9GAMM|nr:methyl-accepting chemotaxis protein [Thalassotalea insulae]GLX80347.1 methyl-accepting chemotaxis protein [Thalassotalea insulae]
MTIKVAHKVIIGFAIVLLMLLLASYSSMSILKGIDSATKQVDNYAIPVKQHSNQMQVHLLKQTKISLLIPTIQLTDTLAANSTSYDNEAQALTTEVTRLSALLKNQQTKALLQQFNLHYQDYDNIVKQMLQLKQNELSSSKLVINQYQTLDQTLDAIEEALIELSYIEDENNPDLVEQLSSMAVQNEGYIINLRDSIKAVTKLPTTNEVEELQGTIELALTNIEQLLAFLSRLGAGHHSETDIAAISNQFKVAQQLIEAQDNLFATKTAQLTYRAQIQQAAEQSKQYANQAINVIEQLLLAFEQNFNQLQTQVFNHVDRGQTTTLVILVVVIVAGSSIAYITIRAMIVPLSRINKVLSYIAKGDLSRQLTINAEDEYGELSKNVNLVVEDLRRLIGEISTNASQLNQSAQQSKAEISEVADSLQQQKQTVEQVTTITTELNESADNILAKASNTEQEMENAISQSSELESIANTTNDRISHLVTVLDATATVMTSLQNEATNIGGILETIQSIADQTNLLALNAAIEAARAGEAGRGFAVVADEVRLLASRTQESTAEIHAMIDALQSQTNKAVKDIDSGKDEANDCQQYTNKLLETLLFINQAIEKIHQMSADIANEAKQQNNLSNEINSSILEVAKQSSQSNDKSLSTISHSEQVTNLAQQLDKSVDQFKM